MCCRWRSRSTAATTPRRGARRLPGRTSQGAGRSRAAGGPDAGLRREVLRPRQSDGRAERALLRRGHAVRERPRPHRLAQGSADHRPGAAVPERPHVRALVRTWLLPAGMALMAPCLAAAPNSNTFSINGREIKLSDEDLLKVRQSWGGKLSLQTVLPVHEAQWVLDFVAIM